MKSKVPIELELELEGLREKRDPFFWISSYG